MTRDICFPAAHKLTNDSGGLLPGSQTNKYRVSRTAICISMIVIGMVLCSACVPYYTREFELTEETRAAGDFLVVPCVIANRGSSSAEAEHDSIYGVQVAVALDGCQHVDSCLDELKEGVQVPEISVTFLPGRMSVTNQYTGKDWFGGYRGAQYPSGRYMSFGVITIPKGIDALVVDVPCEVVEASGAISSTRITYRMVRKSSTSYFLPLD